MKQFLDIIKKCPLFNGICDTELLTLLNCLSAIEREYEKNRFIFLADEKVTSMGIVLLGSVHIIQEDFWGSPTILTRIGIGGLFGESFSCAETDKLPVSVLAAEKTKILMIDYRKIITSCPTACTFHTELIKNMLKILAQKNVMLMQKMEFITQRTTRERLMSYLSALAREAGDNSFDIPFNRQELAEYLSVERSAMSAELSRMKKDGILTFRKNHFELLESV